MLLSPRLWLTENPINPRTDTSQIHRRIRSGYLYYATVYVKRGTVLIDANKYSTGDTVKLNLEDNSIIADYPLAQDAVVLVISGRHIGAIETVEKYTVVNRPTENIVTFKSNTETVKANIFVIGTGKSELPEVSE